MTDWNPNDPDATRVYYDLSMWTFDQQAELTAAMADAEVPHAWEGTELMVPEESEAEADAIIAEIEERLGIVDEPMPERPTQVVLADDVATTEYDLADWSPVEHDTVSHALTEANIPFRWDGAVLLVATDDEAVVDELLDDVESGEYADVLTTTPAGEESSSEVLTLLFLAAERLRKEPLDADGIEHLLKALDLADPEAPPFGVAPKLWNDAYGVADELADAIAGDETPDDEAAMTAAERLHELLRPHV
jgi:hypothetical protein